MRMARGTYRPPVCYTRSNESRISLGRKPGKMYSSCGSMDGSTAHRRVNLSPVASLKYTLMRSSCRSESPWYEPVGSTPCSSEITSQNYRTNGRTTAAQHKREGTKKGYCAVRFDGGHGLYLSHGAYIPWHQSGYRIALLGRGRSHASWLWLGFLAVRKKDSLIRSPEKRGQQASRVSCGDEVGAILSSNGTKRCQVCLEKPHGPLCPHSTNVPKHQVGYRLTPCPPLALPPLTPSAFPPWLGTKALSVTLRKPTTQTRDA